MVNLIRLNVKTQGQCQILDVTPEVSTHLSRQPLQSGVVTVFVPGSTAGLTTIEYEHGLLQDFQRTIERLVPSQASYDHNRHAEDNGHSHIQASLLGPSVIVPFQNKKLLLGTWQQIVLVDFDTRPRSRELILQFLGE